MTNQIFRIEDEEQYKAWEMEQETLKQNYIDQNDEYLKDIHAEGYNGTDDDMPDRFESWMADHTQDELVTLIKNAILSEELTREKRVEDAEKAERSYNEQPEGDYERLSAGDEQ